MSLINRPVKIDAKRWTSSSRPHQPLLSSLLCSKRPSSLLSAETLGSSQQPTSRGLFLESPQCTLNCVDPCGFPLCPAPPCPQRMFTWHCSIGVGSCLYIVEHCDFKEEGFRQEKMISRVSPVRTGQGIFKPNFQQILPTKSNGFWWKSFCRNLRIGPVSQEGIDWIEEEEEREAGQKVEQSNEET